MKQEEQDLLLKDLCGRLPHGVWIERKLKSCKFSAKCMLNAYDIYAIERGQYDFCRPYLFPLSSMTEEQKREYEDALIYHDYTKGGWAVAKVDNEYTVPYWFVDFCNKNHLDYRGLIEKGLAIDATNLLIY